MDSGKLFRILIDLQSDESILNLSGQIAAIRTDFIQNTPESFALAEEKISNLLSQIKSTSITYTYSPSEYLFLQYIEGNPYFGKGLVDSITKIFSSRSYEIVTKIDEYTSLRNDFITRAQRLATGFADMKIGEWRPAFYEVGIVLPHEQEAVIDIVKVLKQFDFLMSGIIEGVTGKHENVKITRLSNGSVAFFSPQDIEIAFKVTEFLASILVIWTSIEDINDRIIKNDKDKLISPEGKAGMKKVLEKEIERVRDRVISELPNTVLVKYPIIQTNAPKLLF